MSNDSRLEAVRCSQDPVWADDGAAAHMLIVNLEADLPRPSSFHRLRAAHDATAGSCETLATFSTFRVKETKK